MSTWLFCFKYWWTRVAGLPSVSALPPLPSEELDWKLGSEDLRSEELELKALDSSSTPAPSGISIGSSSSTGCPKISRTERVASRTLWFCFLIYKRVSCLSIRNSTLQCQLFCSLFYFIVGVFPITFSCHLSVLTLRHEAELGFHSRLPPRLSTEDRIDFTLQCKDIFKTRQIIIEESQSENSRRSSWTLTPPPLQLCLQINICLLPFQFTVFCKRNII